MDKKLALLLSLSLACGAAWAEEKKPEAKKSAKAKTAAKKSEKNVAQKAEASIYDTADKYNIWKRKKD